VKVLSAEGVEETRHFKDQFRARRLTPERKSTKVKLDKAKIDKAKVDKEVSTKKDPQS